jgi:hypothetical protein
VKDDRILLVLRTRKELGEWSSRCRNGGSSRWSRHRHIGKQGRPRSQQCWMISVRGRGTAGDMLLFGRTKKAHGRLHVDEETRRLLLQMSPATIGQLLMGERRRTGRRRLWLDTHRHRLEHRMDRGGGRTHESRSGCGRWHWHPVSAGTRGASSPCILITGASPRPDILPASALPGVLPSPVPVRTRGTTTHMWKKRTTPSSARSWGMTGITVRGRGSPEPTVPGPAPHGELVSSQPETPLHKERTGNTSPSCTTTMCTDAGTERCCRRDKGTPASNMRSARHNNAAPRDLLLPGPAG